MHIQARVYSTVLFIPAENFCVVAVDTDRETTLETVGAAVRDVLKRRGLSEKRIDKAAKDAEAYFGEGSRKDPWTFKVSKALTMFVKVNRHDVEWKA